MDKAALVSIDVERGSRILEILNDAGLQLEVALWAVLREYGDWRLVLSSRKFDAAGLKEAYGLLHDTLDAAGFTLEEGMRLGGQSIGNRFIEDAYTYLVS